LGRDVRRQAELNISYDDAWPRRSAGLRTGRRRTGGVHCIEK
jgi:hypothetical protein